MADPISKLLPESLETLKSSSPSTSDASLKPRSESSGAQLATAQTKPRRVSIPNDGLSVFEALGEKTATISEFEAIRILLEESFEEIGDFTWNEFRDMATEEGWTEKRLRLAARNILRFKSSWVPPGAEQPPIAVGDFYRYAVPRLYPYSWYEQRIAESRTNALELACYITPDGLHGWGWCRHLDGILPRYEPRSKKNRMELPEPEHGVPADVQEKLHGWYEKVDQSEAEKEDERSALQKMADDRNSWKEKALGLQQVLTDLIDGRISIEEYRAMVKGEEKPVEPAVTWWMIDCDPPPEGQWVVVEWIDDDKRPQQEVMRRNLDGYYLRNGKRWPDLELGRLWNWTEVLDAHDRQEAA